MPFGGIARGNEAQEWGEPWADELVALYREALDRYGAEHGVRLDTEESSSAQWPQTVGDAVQRLMGVLPEEQKAMFREMAEADLSGLHFGLTPYIRDEFGLHSGNEALRSDVTQEH